MPERTSIVNVLTAQLFQHGSPALFLHVAMCDMAKTHRYVCNGSQRNPHHPDFAKGMGATCDQTASHSHVKGSGPSANNMWEGRTEGGSTTRKFESSSVKSCFAAPRAPHHDTSTRFGTRCTGWNNRRYPWRSLLWSPAQQRSRCSAMLAVESTLLPPPLRQADDARMRLLSQGHMSIRSAFAA